MEVDGRFQEVKLKIQQNKHLFVGGMSHPEPKLEDPLVLNINPQRKSTSVRGTVSDFVIICECRVCVCETVSCACVRAGERV